MSIQTQQDQYVKVGNVNTRFWTAGDEGTTVILIHGLGESAENWMLNISALAQHHRVYAVDLAGFGRSDKTQVLRSLSQGAQFVSDFMEVQRIEKASLVGHSMGGGVTLQFAIQFPSKVEKLVLANSAGLGKELALVLRLAALPLIGELLTRPSRKGTARFWKECVYDPALLTDELVELYYHLASLPGAQKSLLAALCVGCNFWGQHADMIRSIVDNLATITTPTLILWGQQDGILPVAHARVAEGRIPNATLQILDYCGHTPQFERPEEFNALVLEFLSRQEA